MKIVQKSYRYVKNLFLYKSLDPTEFFYNESLKIVYIVNPKVACSSIKRALLDKEEEVNDNYGVHRVHGHNYRGKLNRSHKEFFKFTFVRNPFDRIYSCYKSKFQNDIENYGRKIPYFDNYLFGYLSKVKNFEEFVDKIIAIPDKYADRHFKSQNAILQCKDNLNIDFIGRMENMEEDSKILLDHGVPKFPHYNRSDTGKKKVNEFSSKVEDKIISRYYDDFRIWYPECLE